jgi:acyl-CoA hydrolase
MTGERRHTTSAYLTFVAIDENGKPVRVAPVVPETDEEMERYEAAAVRRQYRLALRKRAKEQEQP